MGSCFSKINNDDDISAPYSEFHNGNYRKVQNVDYHSYFGDFDRQMSNERCINRMNQKPLCFFGKDCTRQNQKHFDVFSHDEFDYNGVRASKNDSLKKYPDGNSSQSHLGGGCAQIVHPRPDSFLDERMVRNAGLALITCNGSIVLVIEKTGKLNFPSGELEKNETSLGCAIREAGEELGIQKKQGVMYEFHSGISQNIMTFVKTHHHLSKTVIYVLCHKQSSDWFSKNFSPNSECSAIVMMSIPDFIRNVEQTPHYFRFPESMTQFVAQLKQQI